METQFDVFFLFSPTVIISVLYLHHCILGETPICASLFADTTHGVYVTVNMCCERREEKKKQTDVTFHLEAGSVPFLLPLR